MCFVKTKLISVASFPFLYLYQRSCYGGAFWDIFVLFLHKNVLCVLLILLLLSTTCPILANSVDPDQLASEKANWSESALFVIKYVNFYQKLGSSNLIGWKLEVGMVS